jgi:hypothetical protein
MFHLELNITTASPEMAMESAAKGTAQKKKTPANCPYNFANNLPVDTTSQKSTTISCITGNSERKSLKGQSHEKVGEIRVRGGILGPN